MRILAIDPGPEISAYIVWDDSRPSPIIHAEETPNRHMLSVVERQRFSPTMCAIEMVACYGMPVGAETFDTCRWIGRFEERWGDGVQFVYRKDVKMHLCHSMRAKDANIRQALIDKHGPVGTKKNPGKLYGISGHLWAALAVADFARQALEMKGEA